MSKLRRGPWSQREDATLVRLVQQQGPLNWVKISDTLISRSPKQCRERYHQNLKPSLNHEPISAEEGQLIEKLVSELGKRWAEIARRLNNRSDNAVKNWWNGSQNRRKRLLQRRRASCGFDGHQAHQAHQVHQVHQAHHHPAAPLDHPRRPQLELATGAAHMFPGSHRHEPSSPCTVHFAHATHNAPPPSGLPSPNSDGGSLYSGHAAAKDPAPALPPHSPISLPPLRRNSYDAVRPTFRPDPLLAPTMAGSDFRLPPIQTLAAGERHPLPTAPNSPLDSASGSVQQHHDAAHLLSRCHIGAAPRRSSSQHDEGDARLRVSHLVD
ncbi:putative myb-like DNA-binding domain-containing protein [Rosellinia necatrix]|uniref:Putative myb-like DNA-binding domain-containing protein n=1 Tax=Rosellinia necatrix TaxID=77044 RepID=A0A1W2TQW7_ROSNE|nr:putative myb-like DNA-binding domain-containing protein [Rosellinia necatrix]